MSIPSDLFDQLLTGYLDDALSPDERARVESLLQSNPQVSADLAELRAMQASLREIADLDSTIRLDAGFADRVLGAAVDRARTEGLNEDHPLVRLTDQPSSNSAPTGRISLYRYAGVMVGLAASIAIAVFALRGDPSDDKPLALAGITQPENAERERAAIGRSGDLESSSTDESIVGIDSFNADGVDAGETETGREAPEPMLEAIATVDRPTTDVPSADVPCRVRAMCPVLDVPSADVPSVDARSFDASKAGLSQNIASQAAKQQQPAVQLGAILVLEVRLTAAGQMSNAIASSMRTAGLQPADEKALPGELAEQLASSDEPIVPEGDMTVLYLQATAKKLDRFYLSLLADQAGVESVGMSLAVNAPILQIVRSLTPDPTTIRHANTSLELSSEQSVVGDLAGQLSRLDFAPLSRETATAMSQNDPDEPAQILLLVR